MKKFLLFCLWGLISIVMCDCVSYRTSYPKSATAIIDGKCKSEAYLVQIFNLTNKDSLQISIEDKHIDLKTMNHLDSMYFEGETHYYFNIAVWRKPFTKDYYVYSLNHDFNKYNIPKTFHKKDNDHDIEINSSYKDRTYQCALKNAQDKCVLISVCQDSLAIRISNRISLLD